MNYLQNVFYLYFDQINTLLNVVSSKANNPIYQNFVNNHLYPLKIEADAFFQRQSTNQALTMPSSISESENTPSKAIKPLAEEDETQITPCHSASDLISELYRHSLFLLELIHSRNLLSISPLEFECAQKLCNWGHYYNHLNALAKLLDTCSEKASIKIMPMLQEMQNRLESFDPNPNQIEALQALMGSYHAELQKLISNNLPHHDLCFTIDLAMIFESLMSRPILFCKFSIRKDLPGNFDKPNLITCEEDKPASTTGINELPLQQSAPISIPPKNASQSQRKRSQSESSSLLARFIQRFSPQDIAKPEKASTTHTPDFSQSAPSAPVPRGNSLTNLPGKQPNNVWSPSHQALTAAKIKAQLETQQLRKKLEAVNDENTKLKSENNELMSKLLRTKHKLKTSQMTVEQLLQLNQLQANPGSLCVLNQGSKTFIKSNEDVSSNTHSSPRSTIQHEALDLENHDHQKPNVGVEIYRKKTFRINI